jgi:DNA-binding transcriptional LysR family regulator
VESDVHLNLKKLEAFKTVVEKQNFSEAAAILNSSQPAVSLKIKSLEEELGIELLNRNHSLIHATPAGMLVYQTAKDMLKQWDQLLENLHLIRGSLTGTLTIGASTIPGTYLLSNWLKNFHQLYPNVHISVHISDSKEILSMLQNHQIDIAIVGVQPSSPKMNSMPITNDSLVFITPPDTLFTSINHFDFSELLTFNMILRENGSGTKYILEKYLSQQGYSLSDFHHFLTIGSTEAVISAVEAGLGISFVSKLAAKPAAQMNRIRIIETVQPYERNFYLTALEDQLQHPIIKEFYQFIIHLTQAD